MGIGKDVTTRYMLALLLLAINPAWGEERHNWFNDPFIQLSADRPYCPTPDGPLLTEEQMRAQSHHRIESGSLCYLSGQCAHASAYGYDQGIADAARRSLQGNRHLHGSTLWITVQRRYVFLEGCAVSQKQIDYVRKVLSKLHYVQYVGTDGASVSR